MHCIHCGAEWKTSDKFCRKCGERVSVAPVSQPAQTESPMPLVAETTPVAQQPLPEKQSHAGGWLLVGAVVVLGCLGAGYFFVPSSKWAEVAGLIYPSPQPPTQSSALSTLFKYDTLYTEISWLEATMTGPAKRGSGDLRRYDIDGCEVEARIEGTSVRSLKLSVSDQCTFNPTAFGLDGLAPLSTLTFGQFATAVGKGYFRSTCVVNCGNAVENGTVSMYYHGPHALNWIGVRLERTLDGDDADSAWAQWAQTMREGSGDEYVSDMDYNCDAKYDDAAHEAFKNVRIDTITIGDFPETSDCDPVQSTESTAAPAENSIDALRRRADAGDADAQNNVGVMYANGQGVVQDYAQAVAWYRKAAEQGDADGQFNLGWMYKSGQGVVQDYAQALAWFRKSAEQGDAFAQINLGMMYDTGEGVVQDDAQAVAWYRKAAEQGDANAQNNLGVMYYSGQGAPKDYTQAVAWHRKAAEQGDAVGQYSLGWFYFNGTGVPKDDVEAHKWINLAAAHAPAENQKKWADFRDDLENDMTPQQVADAKKLAREWQAAFDKRRK